MPVRSGLRFVCGLVVAFMVVALVVVGAGVSGANAAAGAVRADGGVGVGVGVADGGVAVDSGVGVAAGVAAGAAAATAADDANATIDHTWTVTLDDGVTPASTGRLFGDQLVVPGGQITDAYRIRHGAGVNGPLDVRARALSGPTVLEGHLSVTLSTPGGSSTTVPMRELLRDGEAVRVVDAMSRGDVRLQIAVGLDSSATNPLQEGAVRFEFVLTVAGTDVVIPEEPGGPDGSGGAGPGGGGGDGAVVTGPGGPGGLSRTGVDSVLMLVAGAMLAGAGLAVLGGARRRRGVAVAGASQGGGGGGGGSGGGSGSDSDSGSNGNGNSDSASAGRSDSSSAN